MGAFASEQEMKDFITKIKDPAYVSGPDDLEKLLSLISGVSQFDKIKVAAGEIEGLMHVMYSDMSTRQLFCAICMASASFLVQVKGDPEVNKKFAIDWMEKSIEAATKLLKKAKADEAAGIDIEN